MPISLEEQVPRCHPHRRIYAKGLCRGCYDAARFRANPEMGARVAARNKKYAAAYYERRKAEFSERDRAAYHAADPGFRKNEQLLSRYGITTDDYLAILKRQGGTCAICPRVPGRPFAFYVDHDHQTGQVRGVLCPSCNTSLGGFADSPDRLRRAISYLEEAAMTISLEEQLRAVRREIGQRKHVYPRLVSAGRMTAQKAADEIAAMEAVLVTVEAAAAGARLL